jgi:FkbM family methyltransferase
MPTANRRHYVAQAIRYFLRQDYRNKELVILDDGAESAADVVPDDAQVRYVRLKGKRTLGAKRNECVKLCRGNLIMHWDDDDWMAPHRIGYQTEALLRAKAEVCGLRRMLFYELETGKVWLYEYPARQRAWLAGGSLLYTKDFWRRSPFPDIQVASDTRFVWNQRLERAVVLPDYNFYVATIHPGNTSRKSCRGSYWKPWTGDIESLLGQDMGFYRSLSQPGAPKGSPQTNGNGAARRPSSGNRETKMKPSAMKEPPSTRNANVNLEVGDRGLSVEGKRMFEREITYEVEPGKAHQCRVLIKNVVERIQAKWSAGIFYETQRHGMLNVVYRRFQGGTFIDIGACIGNHSLFFALCCNADRVLAFEPVKEIFDHLEENIRLNRLENVRAKNIALGNRAGEAGMIFSTVPPERGGMMINKVDESGTGVRLDTLDRVLAEEKVAAVTCIKIDVEGYNLPVLHGARQTILTHHPAIFCECETDEAFREVDAFLSALGYRVWAVEGKPFVMNHTPTYLWEYVERLDVTVVITTYNRPQYLERLLRSLIADAEGYTVNCLIYNDRSDVSYDQIPEGNERFRLKLINLPEHHGKRQYWRMVNRIFRDLEQIESRYFMQLPDDVEARPGFFSETIATYEAIINPNKICLNLYLDSSRIGKSNWTRTLPVIERHSDKHVFRTGWVDMCYIAEKRFFEALRFTVDQVPPSRWHGNPRLSSGVGQQITQRLGRYGMYQVRDCALKSAGVPSLMNPDRPKAEDLSICQLDPIMCGVASIPERAENLRLSVQSILPCVDELHVYLNGYMDVPAFLDHPKVKVYRSQDFKDLGDAGKFFKAGEKRGFFITIDDDIIYPADFVWKLVNEIRHHRQKGLKVAVGLHGKIMARNVSRFYRDHTEQFHGASPLKHSRGVHILGTGTAAFHTDDLKLTIDDFNGHANMADIHFGIACQKQNVGCLVLPRPANYLTIQRIPVQQTIWGKSYKNDELQTNTYNRWTDWKIRA